MFSIIIPVYNVEKHLDKCLHSVIYQTYKNIEIIIINDGSTDNSKNIIEKYCSIDNRIKVISQKNSGQSAARNIGLEFATQEYIMFVDGDDYIEINTCECLAEYIEKIKSDVYIFGLYYNSHNRQNIGRQKLQYKYFNCGKKYMESALLDGNFRTFTHSKLFKNSLLGVNKLVHSEKIRFINGFTYEDMLFVVQALCKVESVSVIPEYLYHYVQHKTGRTSTQYREKDLDALIFIKTLYENYYKTGEINKLVYAVLVFRWVSSCLIYKYIDKYLFNHKSRKIIGIALNDTFFIEAVKICVKEKNIPKRDKYLAIMLIICPSLYKIASYIIIQWKKYFY